MSQYKVIYSINNIENEVNIIGADNIYLKVVEEKYKVQLLASNGTISMNIIDNETKYYNIEKSIVNIFTAIERLVENKIDLTLNDIYSIVTNIDNKNCNSIINLYMKKDIVYTTHNGKAIYPKSLNQKLYIQALEDNDIVFALGPAGTGKTYLAVMFALKYLKMYKARRIVLVRPIVEAGEKLGFLPGDLKEKIDPYLLPIYDNLYEAMGKETITKMLEKGVIEVAPLAYMRGRTLENAIIILDEAQNATLSQMKMFLTRLGFNSKMIITGDITQIDLPNKNYSGLIEATDLLEDIEGIKIIRFQKIDVMRHPLVFKIIEKYENR